MTRGSILVRAIVAGLAAALAALGSCVKDEPIVPVPPPRDSIPPAAVADLGAPSSTASEVTLVWTSPGDDGKSGTAARYDIRCGSSVIGSATWATAYEVPDERGPKAAGLLDTFTVSGLSPNAEYYFAMKTADEAGNWSALSNVARRSTLVLLDTIPPAAVLDLAAGHASARTVSLVWTAPGDDGATGTAASYDIRYAASAISEADWGAASRAGSDQHPQRAGSGETFSIAGLARGTTYYFALKAIDDRLNESPLSNVASATTFPCTFCWLPLGTGLGAGGTVACLAVYRNGLVVSGRFGDSGGAPGSGIAAWNGASWTSLGEGLAGGAHALAVYGDRLIAAGDPGAGDPASLRAWDGTAWRPFPGIYLEDVLALIPYGSSLVAGGSFTSAGGVAVNAVAIWDGGAWRGLGSGMSSGLPRTEVRALAIYNGELVAAGRFAAAGSFAAANIARWDGVDWIPLGSGLGGGASTCVSALAVYGGRLIAGGSFTTAGGAAASNIAAWDGSAWSPLGAGVGAGAEPPVRALAASGGRLVTGGSFATAGGAHAPYLAAWDGARWASVGAGFLDGSGAGVEALVEYGGNLIAGGDFTSAGDSSAVAVGVLVY
jgi:hypothetical protein